MFNFPWSSFQIKQYFIYISVLFVFTVATPEGSRDIEFSTTQNRSLIRQGTKSILPENIQLQNIQLQNIQTENIQLQNIPNGNIQPENIQLQNIQNGNTHLQNIQIESIQTENNHLSITIPLDNATSPVFSFPPSPRAVGLINWICFQLKNTKLLSQF